jgi:hypothetical protein
MIVNGININQTISDLLKDRLFVWTQKTLKN